MGFGISLPRPTGPGMTPSLHPTTTEKGVGNEGLIDYNIFAIFRFKKFFICRIADTFVKR